MNDIKLQSENGFPLDENLRPLKIGNKTAPLELSDTDVRVNNLYVNGTTTGVSASDDTKLPLAGGTMTGDITTDSDIISTDLTINDSGDISLDADGADVIFKDGGLESGRITSDVSGGGVGDRSLSLRSNSASGYYLILDAQATNGALQLESGSGNFIMSKGATEFSASNSAYAGMILGYTRIQNDGTGSTNNVILIGTSFSTIPILNNCSACSSLRSTVPPSFNFPNS